MGVANRIMSEGRVVWDHTIVEAKTDVELGYNGITWNGYKLPVGVRISDKPPIVTTNVKKTYMTRKEATQRVRVYSVFSGRCVVFVHRAEMAEAIGKNSANVLKWYYITHWENFVA